MGIFDLFGRDSRIKNENKEPENTFVNESIQSANQKQSPVSIFAPKSYAEVEGIIDALKQGKTAMVHLDELKIETATRILDMLSGAIYALGGGVYEMKKQIFMFAPNGIEIK